MINTSDFEGQKLILTREETFNRENSRSLSLELSDAEVVECTVLNINKQEVDTLNTVRSGMLPLSTSVL